MFPELFSGFQFDLSLQKKKRSITSFRLVLVDCGMWLVVACSGMAKYVQNFQKKVNGYWLRIHGLKVLRIAYN